MRIVGNEVIPYGIEILGLEIRFYAICILLGAGLSLFFAKRAYKKMGYDPSLFDTGFVIVLLAGLIGARIWYVLVESPNNFFGEILNFRQGGLAVQGGVVLATITGILYFKIRHYKVAPVMPVFDSCVPTILIAQSLGRWGNFFNHEVFGSCVSRGSLFLPDFILNNIGGSCPSGEVPVPLFLVESVLNLIGFILIYFLLSRLLTKKWYRYGTLGASYFIWYGVVRAILEPLRNSTFIMNNFASLIVSLSFIAFGLVFIFIVYFYSILKPKVKLLVFDFDGTLIDNEDAIIECFKYLFKKYRPTYEYTESELLSVLGPSTISSLKFFFNGDYDVMLKDYRDYQNSIFDKMIKPFSDAIPALIEAKKKGIKIAIYTNKERDSTMNNLEKFKMTEYFDAILTSSDLKRRKPSAEGLIKAIINTKSNIFNTVMIGDNVVDIDVGKAIFVRTAAIKRSKKIEDQVKRQPDYIVDNYVDFINGL